MSLVQKHPTDKNKYQSAFDTYGHGEGNGKSRNAIYKHAKKLKSQNLFPEEEKIEEPIIETAQNKEKEKVEEDKWGSISWADDTPETIIPKTIPDPIKKLSKNKGAPLNSKSTGTMIRMGFAGLDRMLSRYGQGVMSKPNWKIERNPEDYDALEESTLAVMEHYNVQIPISPVLVWGATVTSAYAPPIAHIRKNADPNRKRNNIFSKLFSRFRKKKVKVSEIKDERIDS